MNRERAKWIIGGALALPVIVIFLITIRVIGAISTIPAALGKRIHIENWARKLVNGAIDIDVAYGFRDDFLYIMEEHIHRSEINSEEYDRWGLLRQIDDHREEAIEDLQAGETVISIVGAIVTIAIGEWTDVRFAGIALTLVLVFLSVLVVLRVIITDLLSYRSQEVRHDNIELLLLKRGWNRNQINHGTSLVLAALLFITTSSKIGYSLGMRLVMRLGYHSNPEENDRYGAENSDQD